MWAKIVFCYLEAAPKTDTAVILLTSFGLLWNLPHQCLLKLMTNRLCGANAIQCKLIEIVNFHDLVKLHA